MDSDNGILVYYSGNKNIQNIVCFPDGTYSYYPTGGLLMEVDNAASYFLLTEKADNMIHLYPGFEDKVSYESAIDALNWLYGTVTDDEQPVSVALFRSSFAKHLGTVINQEFPFPSERTMGEVLCIAYECYIQDLYDFSKYFDALVANFSGKADIDQEKDVSVFNDVLTDRYEEIVRKCSVRHNHKGYTNVEFIKITDFLWLLAVEYSWMKKESVKIKICENCGRHFIPQGRNDAIYCFSPSPQCPQKTCSEIGARLKRDQKRRTDPDAKIINRISSRNDMASMRATRVGYEPLSQKYKEKKEREIKEYKKSEASD